MSESTFHCDLGQIAGVQNIPKSYTIFTACTDYESSCKALELGKLEVLQDPPRETKRRGSKQIQQAMKEYV